MSQNIVNPYRFVTAAEEFDALWEQACTTTGSGTWTLTDTTARKTGTAGWGTAVTSGGSWDSTGTLTTFFNFDAGVPAQDSLISCSSVAPVGLCTASQDESFGSFTVYTGSFTTFKVYDNQNSNLSANVTRNANTKFKMILSTAEGMKCYYDLNGDDSWTLVSMPSSNPVAAGTYKMYYNMSSASLNYVGTLTYEIA